MVRLDLEPTVTYLSYPHSYRDWTMDDLTNYHDEGFKAFIRQMGRNYENPYPKSSPEHKRYKQGWQQAAFICGEGASSVDTGSSKRP